MTGFCLTIRIYKFIIHAHLLACFTDTKFMKYRILIISFFLLLTQFVFSQTHSAISPKDFGFTAFSIKGTLDKIDFIVSDTSFKTRKPIFLYCQGSLPYALFYKEDSLHTWNQTTPIDYKKHLDEYYFVEISKPGIPIFTSTADSDYYYIDPQTRQTPKKYWDNNYLDYYVTAANDVINYLFKQKWVDKSKLIIAGHSQGSKVVSKLGAINQKVTHVVYLAGNPLGRFDQYIRGERRDALLGKISAEEAQKNIDKLYSQWKKMCADSNNTYRTSGDSYQSIMSFSQPLLPYLLKINVPLFVGYGTNDITSDYCDLLPLDFDRLGKTNLTMKPYLGADHNFSKITYDKTGKIISTEDLWEKVNDDIFKWINSTK